MKPQVQKKKMPEATKENNHRIHQGNHHVFPEAQSPLPSHFLVCGIPRAAPCLPVTPLGYEAGLEVQQKAGSDTLHGSASAILYVSILVCLHLFASKALLTDKGKDPHCRALQKALTSCKHFPTTRSAVTSAVAITLQAPQLPPECQQGTRALLLPL
ncbi:unnamed protein product [Coccothraustes coccothraustes]